jgi:electron transfer flavoprotein beta subunit
VRFGFKKTRTTVTVVNVGGPETEPTLRKALAIGAETNSCKRNPTDGFFVAKQLADVKMNMILLSQEKNH